MSSLSEQALCEKRERSKYGHSMVDSVQDLAADDLAAAEVS